MKTVKVKTSELEGAALDWAVAKAVRKEVKLLPKDNQDEKWPTQCTCGPWWPSSSCGWSQCGPLIEWYGVMFNHCKGMVRAEVVGGIALGDTYLIAACRAIVASVNGEYVEIPEDLLK